MWLGSHVKRQTALAGATYLSEVKEPVHVNDVTENNVMYSQISWKDGCRLKSDVSAEQNKP